MKNLINLLLAFILPVVAFYVYAYLLEFAIVIMFTVILIGLGHQAFRYVKSLIA